MEQPPYVLLKFDLFDSYPGVSAPSHRRGKRATLTAKSHVTPLIPAWVDGKLTPTDKLDVHWRGLRHPAVSVFVMCGDKTLIQRRALSKYHTPGLWANSCCTHQHWDEDALVCAHRRLGEELGITGLTLHHRDQVEYRADVGGGMTEHEIVDIFTGEATTDMTVVPDPHEVADTRWISLTDLARDVERNPHRYTPWLRIYMERHMDRIFGTLRI